MGTIAARGLSVDQQKCMHKNRFKRQAMKTNCRKWTHRDPDLVARARIFRETSGRRRSNILSSDSKDEREPRLKQKTVLSVAVLSPTVYHVVTTRNAAWRISKAEWWAIGVSKEVLRRAIEMISFHWIDSPLTGRKSQGAEVLR